MNEAMSHSANSVVAGARLKISRIAAAHGARNVRVFGSVPRGEASGDSDLDLLVDMAEGRSLFDLVALSDELKEALGVEVDVVTEASLSPYMRDRVLDEAVAL
jgi:predicted nucleotidyltransferase